MDREASTSHDVLERMLLDESAEPTNLPLSLLEDITNCFSLNNEIGSGGFAVVYKGVVGKGTVAVKKLSKTYGIHENKFQEEVKCLIKAKHKNIVRFLGYCSDQQGKMEECDGILVMADQRNMLLCFEYVCNGSLDKHITAADTSDGLNWRQRYQIIRGICEGLLFLHEKRIIHLDLKPANILLDGHMVPKITDFGLSRILSQLQTRAITENICGTRGYMGPEYITSGQITFASDIYSLGVIIIEIMKGERQHFEDEHVVESWRIQLEASEGDMHLEQVRVCYMIGRECMNDDPKKRPIARHIVDRLDKTATAGYSGETSTCSSLFEPHVSLPREQSGESIGKLAAESLQVDVEERSEILEDATKSCEWEGQQKVDTLALCGVQETNQKVNRRGTSISSSISTVFYKLNNLDIFNRKAKRKAKGEAYMHYHTLEMCITIKVFRIEKLKPLITGINLIGKGRFCEVYKGIVNNALVALKILITTNNQLENEAFINEATIMPQISHKNIVRLIGCCLEVDTPILVYELMPNGSMNDILHGGNRSALNLDVRLTIIAESAQGLAYLHSQARIKILHGAVKPEKILLDQNFMPKITGFGLSRLITGDKENATYVIGDMSYMDPVYLQTGLLTLKSDVYSFGVVILEVISRKKATHSDKNSLVRSFLEVHEEGKKATELFDKEIAVTTEDLELLDCLAEIALECLNLDVDQRPTMMDVAERLLILNRSRRSQAV